MVPDSAIASFSFSFDQQLVDLLLGTSEAMDLRPATTERLKARLAESIQPYAPGPWPGPNVNGIHSCERALVLAARAHEDPFDRPSARDVLVGYLTTMARAAVPAAVQSTDGPKPLRSQHLHGTSEIELRTFPSDLTDVVGGLAVMVQVVPVDDFYAIQVLRRPRPDDVVRANWTAHTSGCAHAAVAYVNANGRLTTPQRASEAWRSHLKAFAETPDKPQPSEIFTVLRWQTHAGLARGADSKAARILGHVRAGTLPDLAETSECWDCPVRVACSKIHEGDIADGPRPATITDSVFGPADIERPAPGDQLCFVWEPDQPEGPRFFDDRALAIRAVRESDGQSIGFLKAVGSSTAWDLAWHFTSGGKAAGEVTGSGPDGLKVWIHFLGD